MLVIPVVGAVAVPVAVPVEETLLPGLLLVLVAVGLTGLAGVVVVGVGTGLAGWSAWPRRMTSSSTDTRSPARCSEGPR